MPDGVQPERTSLAWQRTALAFTVAAVAFLRLATLRGELAAVILAVITVAVALVAAAEGSLRHRRRRTAFEHERVALPRAAPLLVVAATSLAVGGVVMAV